MKKIILLVSSLILLCSLAANSQDTYFSESFDDGIPADWAEEGGWTFGTAAEVSSAYFPVADDGGRYACFNDDGLGQEAVGGGTLTTSAIDLTTVTGDAFLNISSYFPNLDYQGSDERALIHISTDMGASWSQLTELSGGSTAALLIEYIDMKDYIGQTVWLQFEYIDGDQWNYGWAIAQFDVSSEIGIPRRNYGINAGGAPALAEAKIGEIYKPAGFVFNNGLDVIESFDVILSDGTTEITENISGLNIEYLGAAKYQLDDGIEITAGSQSWTLSIANINGEAEEDEDLENNSQSFTLRGVEVGENQAVMVEEATGTWCTWCPRGTVFLDEMAKRFGSSFVGVAVHNGDPMVNADYDAAITSFQGFQGFPSVIYNRESVIDPSAIVTPSIARMSEDAEVGITVGGEYDPATGAFVSSVEVQFLQDVDANYNVSVILTEDGVSGTGDAWAQINAYSGGAQGPMGGFEDLPGAVPDYLMVYDHVGRALIGGYDGVANIVSGAYAAGDVDSYRFDEEQIDATYATDKMHVIGLITDASSGEVINARSVSFEDALANGLSTSIDDFLNDNVTVYPNLVSDKTNISVRLNDTKEIQAVLYNQFGQVVSSVDYGIQSGSVELEYSMSTVPSGVYFLNLNIDGKQITNKITKID